MVEYKGERSLKGDSQISGSDNKMEREQPLSDTANTKGGLGYYRLFVLVGFVAQVGENIDRFRTR